MKKILIILLMILAPSFLYAENVNIFGSELNNLIKELIKENRKIASLEKRSEGIRYRADYTGALPDPVAGIGLANIPTDGFDFNQEPMTQKQIFVSQKIPWPSKLNIKSEIELKKFKTSKAVVEKEKALSAKKLSFLYYGLIYKKMEIDANKELTKLVNNIIKSLNSSYSSGKISQQDILTAHVELERLNDEEISLKKEKNILEIKINEILNRKDFININADENINFPNLNLNPERLKKKGLEKNPEILVLKSINQEKLKIIDLAKEDYYPDMNFKASYGQRGKDSKGNDLTDFFSLSASFSIPVWHKKSQDKKLDWAKRMENSSRDAIANIYLSLPHKIDEIIESIEMKEKRFNLYKASIIPTAEKLSRASIIDYRVGRSEFDTMIRRNMDLVKYRLKTDRLKIGAYGDIIELIYLTGGILLGNDGL